MSSDENNSTVYKKEKNTSGTNNPEVCHDQPTVSSSSSTLLSSPSTSSCNQSHYKDVNNDWDTDDTNRIEDMLHIISQYKEIPSTDEVTIHKISKFNLYETKNAKFAELIQRYNKNIYSGHCIITLAVEWVPSILDQLHSYQIDLTTHSDKRRTEIIELYKKVNSNGLEIEMRRIMGEGADKLAFLLQQPTKTSNFQKALNVALHISVRNNDLMCAYMLLCKGANANDPDVYDMPALHLAAWERNVDMVKLILMESQQPLDIDSYRSYDNLTTRELIELELPELSFDSNFFVNLEIPPIGEQTLKFFLNNSDEIKCLKVMGEGFHGTLSFSLIEELLSIATRRKYCKIIRQILRKIVGKSLNMDVFKETAVLFGNHIVLREALKRYPRISDNLILDTCKLLEIPPGEIEDTSDWLECLKLILEQAYVDVRCTDDFGRTPLFYALEARCYEAAILLLKKGSYLGYVNRSDSIIIANIPASVLSSYFNDCIQLKHEWKEECMIKFDYRCLMPHEERQTSRTSEVDVIFYIAINDTLKHLLKHPLILSFFYIKWCKMRYILYANFFFCITFHIFLNAYVLNMTYDTSSSKSGKQIANDTILASRQQDEDISLWVFAMGTFPIFILREILQIVFCARYYLTDMENWLQLLLIALLVALLCGAGFEIGVLVILLSTWKLMILMSHLFSSICIKMLQTVCFNFIRFFFPHLLLIVAFAFSFFMLFSNEDNNVSFTNPGLSIFKTIVMLTGEFDANEIPFSAYPIWSRIVFVLFVFHIVIVLLNLLNGLAINNIGKILNKVEMIGLISQVRLIVYFEKIIVGKSFCWNCSWNPLNFLSSRISLFSHYVDGKINLEPYNKQSTLKMDPNIVEDIKRLVEDNNEPSNDDIMNELATLQKRLTEINDNLKRYIE